MFFNYPPSSGIASCVRTVGTVMWCLHLTRPCYSALGRVLICGFFSIGLSSLPIRARCFPKRREKAGLLLSILIKFVHINTRPQAGFDRPFGECKIYWMKKWRSKKPSHHGWIWVRHIQVKFKLQGSWVHAGQTLNFICSTKVNE